MISYNGTHIFIDGTGIDTYPNAEDYEQAVSVILDRIMGSAVGVAVKNEFEATNRVLKIVPLSKTTFNAFARPASVLGATAKGTVYRDNHGHVDLDSQGHGSRGCGTGTSSTLLYNPRFWVNYCSGGVAQTSGAKPDEILFHEMVHATRQMRGVMEREKLADKYDNAEEFYAILVSNMYASESGRAVDLRLDHHSFNKAAFNTNILFLPRKDMADYKYRLVDQMIKQQPDFTSELAGAECGFNPFRRYYDLNQALR